MNYAYTIIMFGLAVGLLLFAANIWIIGFRAIPRRHSVNPPDKEQYAKDFARLLAILSISPFLSGAFSLFGDIEVMILPSLIVLAVSFILFLIIGIRLMHKQ